MFRGPLIATPAMLALLTACATPSSGPPAPPRQAAPPAAPSSANAALLRYRCDHDIEFMVRFGDDSAQIDAGVQGSDTLLRDAGGVTPRHTVYSSTRMKAEFGLGTDAREARLNLVSPPLEANCVRD